MGSEEYCDALPTFLMLPERGDYHQQVPGIILTSARLQVSVVIMNSVRDKNHSDHGFSDFSKGVWSSEDLVKIQILIS